MALALYIETTPTGEGMIHVPDLPGCCVRCSTLDDVLQSARQGVATYLDWLVPSGLRSLTPATEGLISTLRDASDAWMPMAEIERRPGAPLWKSGNPAALFTWDLQCLPDETVDGCFRFVRAVLDDLESHLALPAAQSDPRRPAPERRSIGETLEHIGNCIWWYASRIDDDLPQPDDIPGESPIDRCRRLASFAQEALSAVPETRRTQVVIPRRYPTRDPREPWTHAKACRREAEHAWEHLLGVRARLREEASAT